MNYVGENTPQTTFLTAELHKLHKEFTAAAAIQIGQPVKLNATGEVVPLGAADSAHLKIGDAIMPAKESGKLVTVMMRGYAELTVEAAAAQDAGPVKWASFETSTGRNRYAAAADSATTQGHALENAAAPGELITVVVF